MAGFESVTVKSTPQGIVQIKDVGRAELGAETYASALRFNGVPAVGLAVQQLSDANALAVDKAAKAELERLSKSFPPGMHYAVAFDTTEIVGASIHEVLGVVWLPGVQRLAEEVNDLGRDGLGPKDTHRFF